MTDKREIAWGQIDWDSTQLAGRHRGCDDVLRNDGRSGTRFDRLPYCLIRRKDKEDLEVIERQPFALREFFQHHPGPRPFFADDPRDCT